MTIHLSEDEKIKVENSLGVFKVARVSGLTKKQVEKLQEDIKGKKSGNS